MENAKMVVADYNGFEVSFTDDAWFNATAVAAKFKKEPAQWLRLPGTKAYLAAFERKYGKITYLDSKRGNGGGTWIHPKLGVPFARWLDDDFAVWCDMQIDVILRGDVSAPVSRAADPLADLQIRALSGLLARIEGSDAKTAERIAEVYETVAAVEEKIDAIPPQIMMERPTNAEAITHIRKRMHDKYLLPESVIDKVMSELSYSPRPAGNVNNPHRNNGTYVVWWVRDVTKTFERFVKECVSLTPTVAKHREIVSTFRLMKSDVQQTAQMGLV
jgi:hypothetical protein